MANENNRRQHTEQQLEYVQPRDVFSFAPEQSIPRISQNHPTVARFALSSSVLPRLTDTIAFTEKIRQALLHHSDGHPVFVGRDEDGLPVRDHSHVYILPEANGSRGQISFISLYCRRGFDPQVRACLEKLRKVWGHSDHDVFFVLVGLGNPEDFAGFNHTAEQCSLFETSSIWVSRTPFVPTRHLKTRNNGTPKLDETGLQIGSPEHDLRRLLNEHGCPSILSITPTASTFPPFRGDGLIEADRHGTFWSEFRISRHDGHGRRASNRGFGFRIEFAEPVSGPLVVGYAAHFGLGLFEPLSDPVF